MTTKRTATGRSRKPKVGASRKPTRGPRKKAAAENLGGPPSLLPSETVARGMASLGIRPEHIERGVPIWPMPTPEGGVVKVPLTWRDLDRIIAAGDGVNPGDVVAWATVNLRERSSLKDRTGKVWVQAGDPWTLYPIQQQLANLRGSVLVCAASAVGKTRDIVLGTLFEVDTLGAGVHSAIIADSDTTIAPIWAELEAQLAQNPNIGGGVIESHIKPYRSKVFKNGARFEIRLVAHDGRSLRGGHYAPTIRFDEAVKAKNPQQWSELWRAADPGCVFRIYSTPDSDYSGEFYRHYERAIPYDSAAVAAEAEQGEAPRFRRFTITKMDLPRPLWDEQIAAELSAAYGGEKSDGWISNVLGGWGTPNRSVFGIELLGPCLKFLPTYRFVTAEIDTDKEAVALRASRPAPEGETLEGDHSEDVTVSERGVPFDAVGLADRIAGLMPSTADFVNPDLLAGFDLGERVDASELTYFRDLGGHLSMLARVRLRYFNYSRQAVIIARLDHAFGHEVRYSVDAGNAGAGAVSFLTEGDSFRYCPICREPLDLASRMSARAFSEKTDAIDVTTGEPLLNPDRLVGGEPTPHRLSNKEFGTRVLEKLLQAGRISLPAGDGGASETKIALTTLLLGHTSEATTTKGERRFKGQADDLVDALRQMALCYAEGRRGKGAITADAALGRGLVASIPKPGTNALGLGSVPDHGGFGHRGERLTVDPYRAEGSDPFESARGSLRGGMGEGWG